MVRNEKGVTLVEILAAVTILSIILVSIFNLFPQIGMMNQQNAMKLKGMNTAKGVLVEWSNREDVKSFVLSSGTGSPPDGYQSAESDGKDYYLFTIEEASVDKLIKINKSPTLDNDAGKTYLIQVELKDKKGRLVSETFGYVSLEGEQP
ncbi:prepilin-type N-terminal cleavage/methylation domain-containing protein [Rossellomorea aquimaris]|uniref:type IV pilus modification PilV family protein n=1 Tax=Rossellomorea aquimaris TaxID=189382 RepID=UPI001CD7CCA5|nr:prepilin-type N-terminal cleavage/methylation domain-containing protein [Rossellomorea aquimaris]MCA1055242.1 prepilin-type N-terminal cleavage/methylation domain-containing protein [Rossellomorea aquimaris]